MTRLQYTRAELGAILDARRRNGDSEGGGAGAVFDFRILVTPELLHQMLGVRLVFDDGSECLLDGVIVNDDGYVEPILTKRKAVRP